MTSTNTAQTVYVLTYDHRHGTDVNVYATQALAEAAAASIARQYWDDMTGSIGAAEMACDVPESAENLTDSQAVSIYFEVMSDRESYEITASTVIAEA